MPSAYPPLHISIHALCEEGDQGGAAAGKPVTDFYPRPLRGGRPGYTAAVPEPANFYPRPLRGGRRRSGRCSRGCCYFYPRPLRGGRRDGIVPGDITVKFLSTPSARRATKIILDTLTIAKFLSTPSARRATVEGDTDEDALIHFYPRPLRGGRRSCP